MLIVGAAASAWLIYDAATTGEAPSQTLALMKYFIIAVLVMTTLYAGAKWFVNPPDSGPKGQSVSSGRAQRGRKQR
ncbi:MAG TPA: hypothetical protein VM782_21155 [Stellaceae bacterium]|nr:hypothetical protein [Stellaceae bacterium]